MEELKILDMSVTWRILLDLGALPLHGFSNKKEIEENLAKAGIIPPLSEEFNMLNRVSRTVCSLIHPKNLFLPLFPIEVAFIPKVEYLSPEEIQKKSESLSWQKLNLYFLLHKSGIGMIKFLARFEKEQTTSEAVASVRLGIQNLLIRLPSAFMVNTLEEGKKFLKALGEKDGKVLLAGNFKDFSGYVLREYIRKKLTASFIGKDFGEIRMEKCISTTLIEVYKTNPVCQSFQDFSQIEKYGRDLRGIGSMDQAYRERADRLVQSTFESNFSDDEELNLYLMGLSDFLIFNSRLERVLPEEKRRTQLSSDYLATKYISYHYECLLDWVYMERNLIGMYDLLLSRSMARESIHPEEMLLLQKNSMQDLIEYTDGITPYTTRANILERARVMYRLPEEQERLEKKRDMVTEYVMQEYSLRTNRGIQLLNMIISASIAFGLMQLAIQVAESKSPSFWGAASVGAFVAMLGVFYFLYNRIVNR